MSGLHRLRVVVHGLELIQHAERTLDHLAPDVAHVRDADVVHHAAHHQTLAADEAEPAGQHLVAAGAAVAVDQEWLARRYGASQLVLGTDDPYDMGETDPLGLLARTRLSALERQGIAGLNAARLLGLPLPMQPAAEAVHDQRLRAAAGGSSSAC